MKKETIDAVLEYFKDTELNSKSNLDLVNLFAQSLMMFNITAFESQDLNKALNELIDAAMYLTLVEMKHTLLDPNIENVNERILWYLNNYLNYNQKIDESVGIELIEELILARVANNKEFNSILEKYQINFI